MSPWQMLLIGFMIFNLILFTRAYKECKNKNAYGSTKILQLLGMFVWGDVFIFSIFWALVALASLVTSNLYLFLLITSLFWVVRSFGETIYWFNQQFSSITREPPEKVELYSIFQNDSVWFIQQIRNQCITVISIVSSIYFAVLWVQSIS
jgi:hypothetical protein